MAASDLLVSSLSSRYNHDHQSLIKQVMLLLMILFPNDGTHNKIWWLLTNRDCQVIENIRSIVKINTKLTNFKIKSQIE